MRCSLKTEGGGPSGPREDGEFYQRPAAAADRPRYSSDAEIGMLARGRLPSSSASRVAAAR
ncbi:hypothetical protein DGM98_14565 [Xanthomonas citri]|uniref:Uncharacterized protein n=1 Tax=Xanthomonas citri pv. phaseoli var. fuscans TaxID=473423 RepID=A0AB33FCJ9_XANCI|nr:hypothetical protein DGM98_14565 [Xanthomonas citri]